MTDTDKYEGMTGDRKRRKGRYITGKQVDNYLNWQADIKQLREEVKGLRRMVETTTKYLSFALTLLTDEQDCEYTHFAGGVCTHDCCPEREEE